MVTIPEKQGGKMPKTAVDWQNSALPCENYINAGSLCNGFYGIVTIW
jgi:hypothetical protein